MSLHDAYTAPGSRCIRHFGRKWSCENAFLRGSRPCRFGFASTIQPESSMDRVRRCCTGEMFQPTRLKGQLTPSCLAARVEAAPCMPSLFCLYPRSHHALRHSIALIVLVFFSFPPHFSGDSPCIPLPRMHNGPWQRPRYGRHEKRRELTLSRTRTRLLKDSRDAEQM